MSPEEYYEKTGSWHMVPMQGEPGNHTDREIFDAKVKHLRWREGQAKALGLPFFRGLFGNIGDD